MMRVENLVPSLAES